jgi:hypothetical protein
VKGMAWRPDGKVIAVAYSNSRCQCNMSFYGLEVYVVMKGKDEVCHVHILKAYGGAEI